jgi:hypothetical protein
MGQRKKRKYFLPPGPRLVRRPQQRFRRIPCCGLPNKPSRLTVSSSWRCRRRRHSRRHCRRHSRRFCRRWKGDQVAIFTQATSYGGSIDCTQKKEVGLIVFSLLKRLIRLVRFWIVLVIWCRVYCLVEASVQVELVLATHQLKKKLKIVFFFFGIDYVLGLKTE